MTKKNKDSKRTTSFRDTTPGQWLKFDASFVIMINVITLRSECY